MFLKSLERELSVGALMAHTGSDILTSYGVLEKPLLFLMHLRRTKVIGLGIESNEQITARPRVRGSIQWFYIPKTGNLN